MKLLAWGALIALAATLGVRAQPAPDSCANLVNLKLGHVTITEAMSVPAAASATYCRVLGTARPTPDSDIRFEVVIPQGAAWNGRYLQVGNGGFAGTIPERSMLPALAQGYAVAGTDDGHQSSVGTDASWALNHPEKQVDFGYRGLKETTDAAKTIIQTYTGAAPKYSYFEGCSDGGREALMEAQRYPGDFNGIVAGDPANYWTHLLTAGASTIQALNAAPGSYIPPEKLKLIQAEAVQQCGDADGVVQDPQACKFRPAKIRCKAADARDCLTDEQIGALNKIYRGTHNPRTGEKVLSGYSPGGEGEANGWGRWITGTAPGDKDALIYGFASNFFRYVVFSDPNYDILNLNFDSDVATTDAKFAPVFNSHDPDLSAFKKRGGKLIQYHGWADPAIPALDSIDYYKSVQAKMGQTASFYRLFMAPGMLHCGGGPGPNVLATLPAITRWVEQDAAPDLLVATKYQDNDRQKPIERIRPLCVYPAHAAWDGKGDKTRLESFRCVGPRA
jgi:hypothetical protein